jgi:hypothetical protein
VQSRQEGNRDFTGIRQTGDATVAELSHLVERLSLVEHGLREQSHQFAMFIPAW